MGYRVKRVLHPGQRAARALDRRPGRHQLRQELQERRRQRLSGCSTTRSRAVTTVRARAERPPPGGGLARHHRPVRGPGHPVRARVRRAPGQPLVRRGAGGAHLLRPRADRTAAVARGLRRDDAASRRPAASSVYARQRDGRRWWSSAAWRAWHRDTRSRRPVSSSAGTRATRCSCAPAGYSNVVLSLDQRQDLQRHGGLARAQARRATSPTPASPRSTRPASPSTGHYQSKLTLMSESLRNDGRVWVPAHGWRRARPPATIPEAERDYYLERKLPGLRQPRPARRRLAQLEAGVRRGAWRRQDGPWLSISTSATRSSREGQAEVIAARYGNLFDMYQRITDEDPVLGSRCASSQPLHYTMGGLWVDYNLETHRARAVRAGRVRTSPTTARTGSAPAP